ncbi:NAD-dependent succinate-semialdehyde dehydrogenase [Ligilactobacillus sp. LYQ60]|uniref:NAD-dependent succinate-semialdehyde dehydrogenase n=1 Tax=unclassified Ligilactobacillus TaxID=2767920 RepID=UPI0038539061
MTYQTTYPYTGKTLKTFPNNSDTEVSQTLSLAHTLYQKWRTQPISTRKAQLLKVAAALRKHRDELAKTITYDMGKLFCESQGEVDLCAMIAEYYAKHAEEMLQPVDLPMPAGQGTAHYIKQATGIIMAVEPWNFPLYQIVRVFAPNFMVGNPMILKDASICPASAQAFDALVKEAGAPAGAFTNLFISYEQVARIIADPRVSGVCLTGSMRGGAAVAAEAGKNLKQSTMELGGNDAFIILDDADWELVKKVAPRARIDNAGQVCTSSKRFIVMADKYDDFVTMLKKQFTQLKMGDPMNPETTLAPLSSKEAQTKLQQQVDTAIDHGATCITGGHIVKGDGFFFEPTILTGITPDNPIFDQEMFGPVATIYKVDSEEAAIKLANNSSYGLGGTIFSSDPDHAERVAAQIETGMSFINSSWSSLPAIPFGGVKNSGYGRELSILGLDAFVNKHLIYTPENSATNN